MRDWYPDFDNDGWGSGSGEEYCADDVPSGYVASSGDPEPDCSTNDTDDCGVCSGSGIDDDACDCAGNVLDECSICGGDNSSCTGCTDPNASNYDPGASIDNGNCILAIEMHTIPQYYNISSIYPNPFNPITRINYGIPEYSKVEIIVYNLTGNKVTSLINEFQMPGNYQIVWNADNYPSGMYFIKLMAGEFIKTQKLMLVK